MAETNRIVMLEVPDNERYCGAATRDSISRGELPVHGAAYYETFYETDQDKIEGITASMALGSLAAATVVYIDHGATPQMKLGIERAKLEGREVEERKIEKVKVYTACVS